MVAGVSSDVMGQQWIAWRWKCIKFWVKQQKVWGHALEDTGGYVYKVM